MMTYEQIAKLDNRRLAQLLKNAHAVRTAGGPLAVEADEVVKNVAEVVARRYGLLTEAQIAAARAGKEVKW